MTVPLSIHVWLAVTSQNGIKIPKRKLTTTMSMHKMNHCHRALVFRASGLRMAERNAGTNPRDGSTERDTTPYGMSRARAGRKTTMVVVRRTRSRELGYSMM